MEERSNVWCTNCSRSFIATMDMSLDGNHQITCPLCGHVHYRVVKNGVVTEERWGSSRPVGPIFAASTSTTTTVSFTFSNTTTGALWLNRTDLTI